MFLLFIMITFVYGDTNSGFPGGFFNYGDKNHDGKIDQSDIDRNLNMAWLMEWNKLVRNVSSNREKAITNADFLKLLTMNGNLQITNKLITVSYDVQMKY